MPDVASVLKEEIRRLARKEARDQMEALKKASSTYRSDIAALKRTLADVEKELVRLRKEAARRGVVRARRRPEKKRRFSPKTISAHRNRLGLSADDYGALVGVTGQSVYKWEKGESRPRNSQLERIAEIREMGKREARRQLAQVREEAS